MTSHGEYTHRRRAKGRPFELGLEIFDALLEERDVFLLQGLDFGGFFGAGGVIWSRSLSSSVWKAIYSRIRTSLAASGEVNSFAAASGAENSSFVIVIVDGYSYIRQ